MLIGLTKGTDTLRFSYDAAGLAQVVNHNGTYYYYLRNGQGDVVKIVDGSGNTVVEYTYDSWGKHLSCTGTLATTLGALNPFRYRGYVYDEETQWYYLRSRYYDPEVCRFISADVFLSTGQWVIGHNCYACCLNNPVGMVDDGGSAARDLAQVSVKGGGGNKGPKPPRVIVLTIPDFERESATWIHKWIGCSWSDVQIVSFSSEEEFINAWNKLCNPSIPVIINAHGSPYSFGSETDTIIDYSSFAKMNAGKMRSLVLLCCKNGQIDVASNNIANSFAALTGVRVYASDALVSNIIFKSQGYIPKDDLSMPYVWTKGWYVYQGGNGHYTKVGNWFLNWGDI